MPEGVALDESADAAKRDAATVTREGKSLSTPLAGVLTNAPVNHVDHRGRVFELYPGTSEFWADPAVYCYAFTVRADSVKGWGLHEHKDDRYTLITGEVLTVLYDARVDSPTRGQSQRVVLTGEGVRQVLIPAGVWHCNINLAPTESYLINHPTQPYVHEQPDRLTLPWDTDAIDVDLSEYFPKQYRGFPSGGRN